MHERIPNSRSPSSLIGKWAVTAAGETEVGPMDGFGWGHQQWDQAMGPVFDANANTARRETRPQPASQIAILQIASLLLCRWTHFLHPDWTSLDQAGWRTAAQTLAVLSRATNLLSGALWTISTGLAPGCWAVAGVTAALWGIHATDHDGVWFVCCRF